MRPLEDASRDIIAQQAAQWLGELPHSDASRRIDFVQWLKRSPTHIEEFLLASTVCAAFAREREGTSGEVEQLIAEALQAPPSAEVMPLHAAVDEQSGVTSTRATPRRNYIAAAAAICVLAIGAMLIVPWTIDRFNTYTTRTGEQRTIRLEDGSRVQMNARSSFIARYSAEARDLDLLEGEAVFDVQHDPGRPFRVHTRDAVIQAVGTQFNVYRQASGRTVVSVLEGVVQVTHDTDDVKASTSSADPKNARLLVRAGQGADVSRDGAIEKRDSTDIARVMSWQNRRLVFREDRLEDIANEFARYSPFHLELRGAAVRDKRITGTFDADDPQSLVMFLDSLGAFRIDTSSQGAVIATANASP